MRRETKPPPPRKEPGLLSKTVTAVIGVITWLITALLLSILVEWIGMAVFWPEQDHRHAQQLLLVESRYLDQRFTEAGRVLGQSVYRRTQQINHWLSERSGIRERLTNLPSPASSQTVSVELHRLYSHSRPYLLAAFYITQVFIVRLALIILSLAVFILFAGVGLVDGLVERYLRRLGGGRESSNVYNLARKSVMPMFISACVIYISLPFSMHPALVMLPFAILFGLSVRVTFDKLKKYF